MFEGIKDINKRVILKLVVEIIKTTNQSMDLKNLETKYNIDKKKTFRFIINDRDMCLNFRLHNSILQYVKDPESVDVQFSMSSDTFISLLSGKTKAIDPATGKDKIVDYDTISAWMNGDITTYNVSGKGSGITNDLYLGMQIWNDIKDKIGVQIGQRIMNAFT